MTTRAMYRNLFRGFFASIVVLMISTLPAFGQQTFNYINGTLDVDVIVSHPCDGSDNGIVSFKVNAANGGSAVLVVVSGPNGTSFPGQTINVGSTFNFTAFEPTASEAGSYDFIIRDSPNTVVINTFPGGPPNPFTLVDLADIVINTETQTNNSNCTTPNGQVEISIDGGSQMPALAPTAGSFTVTWTSNNSVTMPAVNTNWDGTGNLNLATLVGAGLPAGTYTVLIEDNYSTCSETKNITITDPSPTPFNVGTTTPNICIGSGGTITLSDSETAVVTYEIFKNGVATGITLTGTTNDLSFTIPAAQLTPAATYNFTIRGVNGNCTPAFMAGSANIVVAANNTASLPSTTPTLCINTALTAITHTTTGATGISNAGVSGANGLPAGVSATWAGNTITITGTPTASGVFNYSIPLTGGCGTVNATGTITVTPANTASAPSTTPTLCINTALTAITHTTTGATGISNAGVSGANGLPAGVSATWAGNTITITGTPTASGVFNYSIPLTGGCGTVNATGTITVTPANTASLPSTTPTLCINIALTAITHTTTGATGISNDGVSGANGLPAGVSATWAGNTITITGTPTASGVFNYSIPLTGGCSTVNATGTITVTPANTASAPSTTPTLCINAALTAITHTTTGATGISNDGVAGANGLPAGVSATWAGNTITITGTPTASGVFNYSIPLTGGCGTVNATGTITVIINTASAASTTPTLCINTALTAITHTTTGATGISNAGVSGANGLPAGVSATWAGNTITIAGTPTASGVFNYSIPLTGGCGTVNATGTITVTPANTASAASTTPTLCINAALTAITHTTTGATGVSNDGVAGANGLPAGVSATWAGNTITITGTPTASGVFNYSIPLTGGCGTVNATGTITVNINTASVPSTTPTLCINTALTAITHTTTGATGISNDGVAGANGLPAGVSATWAGNTITITGTPSASGIFNYSIPLMGGCGTVNATGTITVTPANTAGAASTTPTLCINTALTAITHTTTGATGISNAGVSGANGLPAGVSATWAGNTITITGTPTASGVFNYSIPLTGGCGTVNATGTITVTPANTASAPSTTPTLCINTALTAITHTTTGATGISNDGVAGANGLPAGVSATWAGNTITITGTPTASGVFNYSIPLTGGCSTVNATGTITVTPANTASAPSTMPTLCINAALTAITHTTTGATGISNDGVSGANGLPAGVSATWAGNTITITGTPTASGVFNYSIPLTGGCSTVNATGTITVTPANTASAPSTTPTLCINAALTAITHTTTGATGISNDGVAGANGLPAGVSATWAGNTITITGNPTASGVFNYSILLTGGCGTVNATGTITVEINTSTAASTTPTLCINTALTAITHTTTGATGISNDGVAGANGLPAGVSATWAGNTITITGTPSASGVFNYSIPLTGGCGTVNATGTITVTPANTASAASTTPTLCINAALTAITHTTIGATGISNDGVSGANGLPAGVSATWAANTITITGTPTASGVFNYSIPLTGGCGTVNATGTITVTPANTASAASTTPTLCINAALTAITHTTTGATGISNDGVSGANGLPAGVSATWAGNTITITGTPTASGVFNYSIQLTGGCGTVNATGTITVEINTSTAASTTPTLCINAALTAITHTTTGATGISNDGVAGANGLPAGVSATWAANTITITGTPTASGVFNYSIPLTGGCGTVNATGTITVTPANTAGAASTTPTLCINTALTAITHTTTGATGISNAGVSGANGLPAGVSATWSANTITITGAPTASGAFNYSIPLTGGCGAVNATGTITVTPANTSSAASTTPTLCINTALTAITHTTTGATGISNDGIAGVNGLPAGVSATWAVNTITITGTPTASGVFNYSIPLTGGCGTVNATGTITVTSANTAGTPSTTPTVCINTALTAITHTTTGATGISNDGVAGANGLPAGVSATWAANTITINGTPTANGVFSYSIPMTGGCGTVNATGTITVSDVPTTSNAGTDLINACGTVQLDGNAPVTGTGAWSFAPGGNTDGNGNIVAPANNQSGFNGTPGITYTLRWIITNGACTSTDNVQIQFDPAGVTPSNASTNQSKCNNGNFTLAGNNPTVGTGTWSIVGAANGATITTPSANNSTVTGLTVGSTVTLRWTITNGACTSTDDVNLTNDASPTTAAAGIDQAVCGTGATLAANAPTSGIGTWTITGGTGGSIANANDPLSGFTGTSGLTYTLQWSVANGSCPASTDNVTIQLDQAPTVSAAGADQNGVCGTVNLNANAPTIGTGLWSFAPGGNPDGLGNIADPANRVSTFNGSTGVTYMLRWSISNGTCTTSTDDVQIQYDPTGPTPSNAGTDQSICGTSTTLGGNNPTTGTGQWSFAPGGNPDNLGVIADVNNQVSGFSGSVGQTYTLRWSITSGTCVSADQVTVQFNVAPTAANAGTDQALCGTSTTLSANTPSNGTGTWSIVSGTGGNVTTPSSPTSGFTGTLGQTYTLRWSISNGGCTASTDDVAVNFNPALCGGGGGVTGTCATVVIVPKPTPAQCTLSNGKIVFSIKPFVPAVNNSGVKIDIQGISPTNTAISRTNYNDSTFNNLPAGTYSFTIEYGDASCKKTGQVTIDQSGTVGTPLVSNIMSPVCDGAATGSLTLDVPGETGNVLEWSLDGGITDPFKSFTAGSTISGIPPGAAPSFTQVLSVRRNASDPCYASVSFVIQAANLPITATYDITPASCDGNDGAVANIVPSGGTGNYEFSINGGINFQTTNSFDALSGGAYILTIKDGAGCIKDFAANVTFPGFINSAINAFDADCSNDGNSGTIQVSILDPGTFQVALSTDQFNEPADSEYLNYSNPSVSFNQLQRGQYFVYMKSNSTTCPTRSAPIDIAGIYALSFEIQPICTNNELSISLINITGEPGTSFDIKVYRKFTNVLEETIPIASIPPTGSVLLNYNDHAFLQTADEYQIQFEQTTALSCVVTSELVDFEVTGPLVAQLGNLRESYPDIATGELQILNFSGGLTAYNIRIELEDPSSLALPTYSTEWEEVELNGDQQYEKVYKEIPPGTYTVQLTDQNGCSLELTAVVPMDNEIFIPNIFTPNDDGINDLFFIRNLPIETGKVNLVISNRWGKEVYSNKNYQNNWKGEGAADGIYYYQLSIDGSDAVTGWVEVLRGQAPSPK